MIKMSTLALGLLIAAPAAALAGPDERADEQAAKIELGRRDGSITWTEGIALRKQQNDIARKETELKSDGYLSRADRRVLRDMQNEADEHIDQEANDGWRRIWWLPRVGR